MSDINEIEKLLPHRDPFLFVDSIESCDEKNIIGYRQYTEDDFFFKGHFPGHPVVPGVLLIEAMAQVGGAGLKKSGVAAASALFFLATVEKAKFRRQVVPGDKVRFEIENEMVSGRMIKQKGKAYVGEEMACQASWMCLAGEAE